MDNICEKKHLRFTQQEISEWMVNHLAELLKIETSQVMTDLDFDNFGLDSRDLVGMVGEISEKISCEVDPSMVYDHPSIEELSEAIIKEMEAEAS